MIRTENLSKHYGHRQAVTGVSAALERDSILVVLGPSGGGKTTLLRLIAGFEQPDTGLVEIDGELVSSPRGMVAPNRRHLGMIFQDLALWPHMTVFSNVAFGLRGRGLSKTVMVGKVETALQQVSLYDHLQRFPHQLSGGEKQRLAIARALVTAPAYLLMDEPFNSLDPILKNEMMKLLKTLKARFQIGIIYVTHNLDEALHLADRIAIMRQGTLRGVIEKEHLSSLAQEDLLAWYTERA